MSGYAELHCHTYFSFLDGASHPEALVDRAVDLGYDALAVTDHDGFYGVSRFWQAATRAGLPAVYGVEVGLASGPAAGTDPVGAAEEWDANRQGLNESDPVGPPRGRSVTAHGAKPTRLPESDHLVLLAGSVEGYRSLSHFVTKAQLRGEKDNPIYAWDDLAVAAENHDVHCLTGCRQGAVPRAQRRPIWAGCYVNCPDSGSCLVVASTSSCGITRCLRTILATTCCGRRRTSWDVRW